MMMKNTTTVVNVIEIDHSPVHGQVQVQLELQKLNRLCSGSTWLKISFKIRSKRCPWSESKFLCSTMHMRRASKIVAILTNVCRTAARILLHVFNTCAMSTIKRFLIWNSQ